MDSRKRPVATKILRQLGENIREARLGKGISQEELADAASIERSYMGAIERGERNPTIDKIYKVCKALKVSSSKLLPF